MEAEKILAKANENLKLTRDMHHKVKTEYSKTRQGRLYDHLLRLKTYLESIKPEDIKPKAGFDNNPGKREFIGRMKQFVAELRSEEHGSDRDPELNTFIENIVAIIEKLGFEISVRETFDQLVKEIDPRQRGDKAWKEFNEIVEVNADGKVQRDKLAEVIRKQAHSLGTPGVEKSGQKIADHLMEAKIPIQLVQIIAQEEKKLNAKDVLLKIVDKKLHSLKKRKDKIMGKLEERLEKQEQAKDEYNRVSLLVEERTAIVQNCENEIQKLDAWMKSAEEYIQKAKNNGYLAYEEWMKKIIKLMEQKLEVGRRMAELIKKGLQATDGAEKIEKINEQELKKIQKINEEKQPDITEAIAA